MPESYIFKIPKTKNKFLMNLFNEILHYIVFYLFYKFAVHLFETTEGIREIDNYFKLYRISAKLQMMLTVPVHIFFFSLYYFKIPFFD